MTSEHYTLQRTKDGKIPKEEANSSGFSPFSHKGNNSQHKFIYHIVTQILTHKNKIKFIVRQYLAVTNTKRTPTKFTISRWIHETLFICFIMLGLCFYQKYQELSRETEHTINKKKILHGKFWRLNEDESFSFWSWLSLARILLASLHHSIIDCMLLRPDWDSSPPQISVLGKVQWNAVSPTVWKVHAGFSCSANPRSSTKRLHRSANFLKGKTIFWINIRHPRSSDPGRRLQFH